MSPHPLTNFEIQKYYQNEPKLNGVYSRYDLPKIKNGVYVANLDEYESIGTHWIPFFVNGNNVTYFDRCRVENILKQIKKLIDSKNIIANIYRIKAYSSIMCRYFYLGFIDFRLKGKSLLEYTN